MLKTRLSRHRTLSQQSNSSRNLHLQILKPHLHLLLHLRLIHLPLVLELVARSCSSQVDPMRKWQISRLNKESRVHEMAEPSRSEIELELRIGTAEAYRPAPIRKYW